MSFPFGRVVVLIDMDCFYVQVEQRRDPDLKGKPCAVVQYNDWKGGGIIAVGYEARAQGVTRGMRGDDAKEKCPDIVLCKVPEAHGKANLDRYREAGAEVINVLSKSEGRVERASIDEAYIDLTHIVERILREKKQKQYSHINNLPNTHVVGWPKDIATSKDKIDLQKRGITDWLHQIATDRNELDERLAIAAAITEELRASVYHQTGFRCSAGISHNKMLAKLACGINKPNKQTALPCSSITDLFKTVKIGKIRNLGGKLGHLLSETFNVQFIGEVGKISKQLLIDAVGGKNAAWLEDICQGIDHEQVKIRHVAQSIGCGKNFPGKEALNTKEKVRNWIEKLMIELSARLEKDKSANNRIARTLTVHIKQDTGQSMSRSGPLLKYGMGSLAKQCYQLIHMLNVGSCDEEDPRWFPSIVSMHVNAKKFDPCGSIFQTIKNLSPMKLEHVQNNLGFKITGSASHSIMNASHDERFNSSDDCMVVALKEGKESINSGLLKDKNTSPASTEIKIQKATKENAPKLSDLCGRDRSQSSLRLTQNTLVKSFFKSMKNNSPSIQSTASVLSDSLPSKNAVSPNNEKASGKSLEADHHQEKNKNKNLNGIDIHVLSSSRKAEEIPEIHNNTSEETMPNSALTNLPKSSVILHPDHGKIDMEVFGNLPDEIKGEIMTSYKISKSQITVQPREKTVCKDSPMKNQRTIFNFLPPSSRQASPSQVENLNASVNFTRSKRASLDNSVCSSKKAKTSVPQSSTKKSSGKRKGNACSTPKFTSSSKDNIVPLGFFRQRLVLSGAISKAITKNATSNQKTS